MGSIPQHDREPTPEEWAEWELVEWGEFEYTTGESAWPAAPASVIILEAWERGDDYLEHWVCPDDSDAEYYACDATGDLRVYRTLVAALAGDETARVGIREVGA